MKNRKITIEALDFDITHEIRINDNVDSVDLELDLGMDEQYGISLSPTQALLLSLKLQESAINVLSNAEKNLDQKIHTLFLTYLGSTITNEMKIEELTNHNLQGGTI